MNLVLVSSDLSPGYFTGQPQKWIDELWREAQLTSQSVIDGIVNAIFPCALCGSVVEYKHSSAGIGWNEFTASRWCAGCAVFATPSHYAWVETAVWRLCKMRPVDFTTEPQRSQRYPWACIYSTIRFSPSVRRSQLKFISRPLCLPVSFK